ncbi:DUF4424 family protein [Zavarzinia compransoris]|nr:DUF4424 family protein [Zavarzinia compransoris]TDP47070.1 uncharacterized protein DUF4424 [Zavarzinia compransoris]
MTSWFARGSLVAALALAGPAAANDSSAALGAGGLTLIEAGDIVMAEEDLYISPAEIRVHYVFDNPTAAPIEKLVAFPLPAIDLGAGDAQPVTLPAPGQANFIDFTVAVAGRPVVPAVEYRAVFKGAEVTGRLKAAGLLDLVPDLLDRSGPLYRLAPATRDDLIAAGLLAAETFDVGQGLQTFYVPQWTLRTTYYWPQVFPPGRLEVEHRYRPVVGMSFLYEGMLDEKEFIAPFCVDAGTRASILKRFKLDEVEAGVWIVDYVLSSGANWAGPIGRFRLTVDKVRPDAIVSFCGTGVKKTSPTTFTLDYRDFEPAEDLAILFIQAFEP